MFEYVGKKLYLDPGGGRPAARRRGHSTAWCSTCSRPTCRAACRASSPWTVESSAQYLVSELFAAFRLLHPEVSSKAQRGQPRSGAAPAEVSRDDLWLLSAPTNLALEFLPFMENHRRGGPQRPLRYVETRAEPAGPNRLAAAALKPSAHLKKAPGTSATTSAPTSPPPATAGSAAGRWPGWACPAAELHGESGTGCNACAELPVAEPAAAPQLVSAVHPRDLPESLVALAFSILIQASARSSTSSTSALDVQCAQARRLARSVRSSRWRSVPGSRRSPAGSDDAPCSMPAEMLLVFQLAAGLGVQTRVAAMASDGQHGVPPIQGDPGV